MGKKAEKAVVTVMSPALAAEAQLGLKDMVADKVVLTLELTELEKAKDTWSMSEDEKVEFGVARKEIGTGLFKNGRLSLALQRYQKVADLFNYIDNFKEENKTKAKELKKVCELNKAACYLKLKEFSEAKKSCEAVLKEESQNVKAIYRRSQAEMGLKNFPECIRDCKRVIELDPQNKDARALLQQAHKGQREEDKKSKGLFANMCKALGKGPIPEPYKAKRPREDDMDDEDDNEGDEEEGVPVAEDKDVPVAKEEDVPVAEDKDVPMAEDEDMPVAKDETKEEEDVPMAAAGA